MEYKLGSMTTKRKGSKEKIFGTGQITISATTDRGDSVPEDAAGQNALVFVLQENEAQNSGPELSCTESSGSKNCRDRPFRRQDDDAERITATGIMVNNSKQHAKAAME
jgi:hypothetical protein